MFYNIFVIRQYNELLSVKKFGISIGLTNFALKRGGKLRIQSELNNNYCKKNVSIANLNYLSETNKISYSRMLSYFV